MNWDELKKYTQARIGMGRAGTSVSTREHLEFQWAHASARDAIYEQWDSSSLEAALKKMGSVVLYARSQAKDREEYLLRPDHGRVLVEVSKNELKISLKELKFQPEVIFIFSDGLSPSAMHKHASKIGEGLIHSFPEKSLCVIAPFGRVALSDEIGEALGAKLVFMVIGERPGLSSHDSAAIYLTYAPKKGNSDAARNCISNIRPPEGLSYEHAVHKATYLGNKALKRGFSGVLLKDETDLHLLRKE